ncbi:MAG: carbamoyl-phosphate synthase (glutamine-hydrolyzing) large subunit [Thaumarchaeota archaeon]|nr:carbamoyl-phosphate synthase (glutamine-hydrolyzing) large subunit [Nitrososphaerota archaeon]
MSRPDGVRKVIVIGSGAIKIGEAGEFDYSGSQALKALREEGIESVLVNPNVATIQTDSRMADKVYFLPVTLQYVSEVIEKERPDGIFLSFGGQTALNCGVELAKEGVLEKYSVKVLGTPVAGINATEDRDLFRKTMTAAGIPVPKSRAAYSVKEAREAAKEIGYPVMVRVAYTLGGRAAGVAYNEYELDEVAQRGLSNSIAHQVLVEEYLGSWKQVEYEVMRDRDDNCITVCNMENMLSMRVHTGDNIVVAPSQTLTNREYHMLREAAIRATRVCGIVGECNIQFALDMKSELFYAIEINARLSRSSALASKATGYPLAYVAAKLALGYALPELSNKVTGVTTACFEPSLDYLVVKMPRWDLQKFERVNRRLGAQMKSVGEVMAIGRCFEEAIQKAIRMLEIGRVGLVGNPGEEDESMDMVETGLNRPTDEILFTLIQAIKGGVPLEQIQKLSFVDRWFLEKLRNVVEIEKQVKAAGKDAPKPQLTDIIRSAKRLGFSDRQIALCLGVSEDDARSLRKRLGITPVVKQIDTLAGEWPAQTNYLYMTYSGDVDDVEFSGGKEKAVVLGAGTYRIGSSVEFDWCTMNMVWGLKRNGMKEVIVVNCNPETVSTDYDMSDRLYFEELTLERVLDIYEKENPKGVVTCVGGQTANNLTPKLAKRGVAILGTSSRDVDMAEDRSKFSKLLDDLGMAQPQWSLFASIEEARSFAKEVGFPVMVRPSYVLSGAAMRVIWTTEHLEKFLKAAARVSPEHPVVISKFIQNAMEVELDAVSDGKDVLIGSVIEHVEKAGIHSGDAIMVAPPKGVAPQVLETLEDYAGRIARALHVKGPFNIQFIVKDDTVYVIECNLRASRSMPFISKLTGINLMDAAALAVLGRSLQPMLSLSRKKGLFGVKVPQFSFTQLEGADLFLGVEMQSTGEVACFGSSFFDALSKAMASAGYKTPRPGGNILITVGGTGMKKRILPLVETLQQLGYHILATEHTSEFFTQNGVPDVTTVFKLDEPERKPNIVDYLVGGTLDLIINIPQSSAMEKYADMLEDEYVIRRRAVELGIPVLTNPETATVFVKSLEWMQKNKPTVDILA